MGGRRSRRSTHEKVLIAAVSDVLVMGQSRSKLNICSS